MTAKNIGLLAAIVAAGSLAAISGAEAVPLSIVNVGAPAVNCVFNTTCTVVVDDSIGNFTPPGDNGAGRLQSRTYPGVAPAPAAGDMAYVYRVDLTSVQGITAVNCVAGLRLDFQGLVPLPYNRRALDDVFVVTSGGLGSVGLASANQVGNTITFSFSAPVCPGGTSYFFGLASKSLNPVASHAEVMYSLGGGATTDVRIP